MADALSERRELRTLTVVDPYTRECLAIDAGQMAQLRHVCIERRAPIEVHVSSTAPVIAKRGGRDLLA